MISHITREGRDALKTSCKVAQIAVRRDLAEVIAGGFEREKPGEDEEIDFGLEELKKRNDPIRRTMHLTMGLQVGLNVKETMLMCPGRLYDMYDIYKEVHGLKERSIEKDAV